MAALDILEGKTVLAEEHQKQSGIQTAQVALVNCPADQFQDLSPQFADAELQPLHTLWPGKNRFCFKGRCIVGPRSDTLHVVLTLGCVGVVGLSYLVFVMPFLTTISVALPSITAYLMSSTVFFYCCTAFTDPGIIPRRFVYQLFGPVPAEFDSVVMSLNDKGIPYKFCGTCEIFRPPKSHHCAACDNCVEQFDHHCPYVNNCIGKRNYGYFCAFVFNALLTVLLQITGLFLYIFYDSDGDKDNLIAQEGMWAIVAVSIAACTVVTILLVVLFGFHISLICR